MNKVLIILALIFAIAVDGQTRIYNCSPACSSNGVCIAGNACKCNAGWAGRTCTVPICTTNCQNGKCTAPDTCTCSPGYDGAYCENYNCKIAGCIHGQCVGASNCKCDQGWTNSSCNIAVCVPGCQNGGNCFAPNQCDCSTTKGWMGPQCQTPICNSTTGVCVNNGVCVGAGVCNCSATGVTDSRTPGWTGRLCEADVNECLLKNFTACDKKTKCSNIKGSYICSACPGGYLGDGKTGCFPTCLHGCSNGGSCIGPNTCNCTGTGFTGTQCFSDLNECTTGGYCDPLVSCLNTVGSFKCIGSCPTNYTGSPYMSSGGCSPICDNPCPTGSKCISPNR